MIKKSYHFYKDENGNWLFVNDSDKKLCKKHCRPWRQRTKSRREKVFQKYLKFKNKGTLF